MLQCNFIGGVFIFKLTLWLYVKGGAPPPLLSQPHSPYTHTPSSASNPPLLHPLRHVAPPLKRNINYDVVPRVTGVRARNILPSDRTWVGGGGKGRGWRERGGVRGSRVYGARGLWPRVFRASLTASQRPGLLAGVDLLHCLTFNPSSLPFSSSLAEVL